MTFLLLSGGENGVTGDEAGMTPLPALEIEKSLRDPMATEPGLEVTVELSGSIAAKKTVAFCAIVTLSVVSVAV